MTLFLKNHEQNSNLYFNKTLIQEIYHSTATRRNILDNEYTYKQNIYVETSDSLNLYSLYHLNLYNWSPSR